jgi:hypothetical protein
MQDGAYRRLGDSLGLGTDPRKAFEYLASPLPSEELLSLEEFEKFFGKNLPLSPADRAGFNKFVSAYLSRYYSHEPPTPFEEPNRYALMSMTFDEVWGYLARTGKPPDPQPYLATLPSGELNASVEVEDSTNARVMFFEQGLLTFLYDFALLAAWATPPLGFFQLMSDLALTWLGRSRVYTMPPQASESFTGTLGGYAVMGTPLKNPAPIPRPTHNQFTVKVLVSVMKRFVMAHELAHLQLGHLDAAAPSQKEAWDQEYEADAAGFALVSAMARDEGNSWAVALWGCDLVLTAYNFLDRVLGLLKFGPVKLTWTSQKHPDAMRRRARLRDQAASISPHATEVGLAAARELCGMSDGLFQTLWDMTHIELYFAYQRGDRPSPMWNPRIQGCMAPSA